MPSPTEAQFGTGLDRHQGPWVPNGSACYGVLVLSLCLDGVVMTGLLSSEGGVRGIERHFSYFFLIILIFFFFSSHAPEGILLLVS